MADPVPAAAGLDLAGPPLPSLPPPRSAAVTYALIGCLGVVAYAAYVVFRPFLVLTVSAASIALLLHPLYRRLVDRRRMRPSLAAGLLVAGVGLSVLAPFVLFGTLLVQQTRDVFVALQPWLEPGAIREFLDHGLMERFPRLAAWLRLDPDLLGRVVREGIGGSAARLQTLIGGALTGIAGLVASFGLFLLILFFLIRDGSQLRVELQAISPLSRLREDEIADNLARTVRAVTKSMVVVPLFQGVVAAFGFIVCGLPSALFWALCSTFAAVVPFVGPVFIWAPAAGYLLLAGHPLRALILALYGTFVISMVDNVLKPLLLRGEASLHPMLGLLAILGGLAAFGVQGLLVGPVVLSLVLSALRVYRLELWRQPPSLIERRLAPRGDADGDAGTTGPA